MPEQKVVLEMDRDLSAFINQSMAFAGATLQGDLARQILILQSLKQSISKCGKEKLNRVMEGFVENCAIAWPEMAVEPRSKEECNHCLCTEGPCCYCGEEKQIPPP